MKKLTAAVCAAVIALSMAGCGSGDSGSTSRKHSTSSAESSGEKAQAIDKLTDFAGGSDESVTLDYELKTIFEDDLYIDNKQADEYVKNCMKFVKALAENDYEAFKEAMNAELWKEVASEGTDSDIRILFDNYRSEFESAHITTEQLENNNIMKVYLQGDNKGETKGFPFCTDLAIALVLDCENNEGYLSLGFLLNGDDGNFLTSFWGSKTISIAEMEEYDSQLDEQNGVSSDEGSGDTEYDKKSRLKTANSNSKTAYVALAENLADAETCGYPMDSVFSGSCDESWQVTPDKVYDASDPESISEGGAKKIAQALCDNGDDAGYFIVLRVQLNGSDGFAVQWTSDPSGDLFGQYPNAIMSEAYDGGGLTFGEYHE